jgi:hypothetical protein
MSVPKTEVVAKVVKLATHHIPARKIIELCLEQRKFPDTLQMIGVVPRVTGFDPLYVRSMARQLCNAGLGKYSKRKGGNSFASFFPDAETHMKLAAETLGIPFKKATPEAQPEEAKTEEAPFAPRLQEKIKLTPTEILAEAKHWIATEMGMGTEAVEITIRY